MTKFKKCDYCKLVNSTVTKYKTAFGDFGKPTHARSIGGRYQEIMVVDQFYLCNDCKNLLIPEDKQLRNNKIDNDFYEQTLKKQIKKKAKIGHTLGGIRKRASSVRESK